MRPIRQSTTATANIGPLVTTNGAAYNPGTSVVGTFWLNGASSAASLSGTGTADGMFLFTLAATNAGSAGRLTFAPTNSANYVPRVEHWDVYPTGVYDLLIGTNNASFTNITNADVLTSSRMATFSLPSNFSSFAISGGGAVTVGTNNDKTGYTVSTVSDKTGYSLASSQTFDNAGQTTKLPANVLQWGGTNVGGMPNTGTTTVGALNTAAKADVLTALTGGTNTLNVDSAHRVTGLDSGGSVFNYTTPPTAAAIATQVENQIMDDTDSRAVLQAIVDKINAADPSLSGLTLTAIANAVWTNVTRALTDKAGFSLSSTQSFNNTGQTTKYAATLNGIDVSGNVPATVTGYTPGQDPGTLVLNTPTNKLISDSFGRMQIQVGNGAGQLNATNGAVLLVNAQTFSTTGAVGTVNGFAAGSLTSAAITAGALNGKGDWLTAGGYTAPDNADVVTALNDLVTLLARTDPTTAIGALQTTANAIKAKTDNLPASPAAISDIPTASANATATDTLLTTNHGSGSWQTGSGGGGGGTGGTNVIINATGPAFALGASASASLTLSFPSGSVYANVDALTGPTVLIYRNQTQTTLVPTITHNATGKYAMGIALTTGNGFANGDSCWFSASGTYAGGAFSIDKPFVVGGAGGGGGDTIDIGDGSAISID